ncbi:MAG: multiheme c-type cytochrome [Planctomycetota bacterium]
MPISPLARRSAVAAFLLAIPLVACVSSERGAAPPSDGAVDPDAAHAELFVGDRFPSATECRACHPDHYREWSVSPHAYAQISPVFNAMHGSLLLRSNGTFGDFCIRCHTPVGMALGEPLFGPNSERDPVSLEGVTCIVCHRQDESFGKNSGRTPIREGDLFAPVNGPRDGDEVARVIASPDEFGPVVTEAGRRGRRIHAEAHFFEPITQPGFCGSCHDVTLVNGFRLEEAFSEYKQSPAAERGETCQDCHMGVEPGVASGYHTGPAAVVGGVPTTPRKRTSHMFPGPDHSVVHPGIYPHDPDAKDLATLEEWTTFDWRAGWGTDAFEDQDHDDADFPERWASIDDRYDAREIVDRQLALLAEAREAGTALLRRGYVLGDVEVVRADRERISVDVDVRNGTDGHSVPTGFVAERLVFLRVTLTDSTGAALFRSGDSDPNGDLRDLHSLYVHAGELPQDDQLFLLQSRFLTRNVRGGEREQVLAINTAVDPLPFLRPETRSSILTGRPGGARIHKMGIEPSGERTARYEIDGDVLTGRGPYALHVELVAGMVPVNLVHEIAEVGFDYGMSPREVADGVLAGHRVLWERTLTLDLE